ncbi:MAG: hypothetical protein M0001_01280 [Treponema sp.]|nr:hypothetical protein [Treponema sp.]
MKRTILLAIAAAAAVSISLSGCASPNGTAVSTYLVSVVPSSVSVQMPKSLVQTGTTAKSLSRAMAGGSQMGGGMMMGQGPMGNGHFQFDRMGMSGYHWIKQGIWDVQKRLARAAWNMVLVDSVVSGQSLAASSATIKGQSVTWTQAMVDAYTAMLPASLTGNANFVSAAKLPTAGTTSQLPDFVYNLVSSTDTTNYTTYYYQVTFSSAGDGEGDGQTEAKTLYWSQDKTKFKFAQSLTDSSTTPATITEQNFVAYDSTSSTMAAGRIDEHGTMQLQLKADPNATATNGVFITYDSSIKNGDAESAFSQSGSTVISAQGYADSSGGTVTETITITDASGAVTVLYLKEGFDPNGQLTSAASSTDQGKTYTTVLFPMSGTQPPFGFSAQLGEVPQMNFGASGNEINAEFRQNMGQMKSGAGTAVPTMLSVAPVSSTDTIAAGPWVASSTSTFSTTTIIGMGFAREAGELKIAFSTVPASTVTFYIAPVKDPTTTPPTLGTAIQAQLK